MEACNHPKTSINTRWKLFLSFFFAALSTFLHAIDGCLNAVRFSDYVHPLSITPSHGSVLLELYRPLHLANHLFAGRSFLRMRHELGLMSRVPWLYSRHSTPPLTHVPAPSNGFPNHALVFLHRGPRRPLEQRAVFWITKRLLPFSPHIFETFWMRVVLSYYDRPGVFVASLGTVA